MPGAQRGAAEVRLAAARGPLVAGGYRAQRGAAEVRLAAARSPPDTGGIRGIGGTWKPSRPVANILEAGGQAFRVAAEERHHVGRGRITVARRHPEASRKALPPRNQAPPIPHKAQDPTAANAPADSRGRDRSEFRCSFCGGGAQTDGCPSSTPTRKMPERRESSPPREHAHAKDARKARELAP
jgi:hypothetical protein